MKHLALFLLAATALCASPRGTVGKLNQMTLPDGRVLKNVVVRAHDEKTSKVLLVAEGHGYLVPVSLVPEYLTRQIRAETPGIDGTKPDANYEIVTPPTPSAISAKRMRGSIVTAPPAK